MKFGKSKHPLTQFYSLQTWISHNALAYGYIYDRNTGVMTGSMYNVNGNFGLRGNQGTSLQFGNNNQLMENFIPFNAWTVRYGARGTFSLPANFGIPTDFTIYTRRRYSEASLNTDNFVWNARLYWSTINNQLLLMLDGFDLLHDLSNVYNSINAQARTETYTNVLPRYVLFHIQWKFHKQPKKH